MKHRERVEGFLKYFTENSSIKLFRQMDEEKRGVGRILYLLDHADGEVCAGDISAELGMSTPHVAAALRGLESKNYITRSCSTADARKVVVALTDEGKRAQAEHEKQVCEFLDFIIDEVGEREWDEFVRIARLVRDAAGRYGKLPQ